MSRDFAVVRDVNELLSRVDGYPILL